MQVPTRRAFSIASSLFSVARRAAERRARRGIEGTNVVVMGGSRGLGLELARVYAEQGANVAICARDEEELDRAHGDIRAHSVAMREPLAAPCDVRSRADVERFIGDVIEDWGRIDTLVYVAGIIQAGPAAHMTREDYRDAMDTHFWGALHAIEAVKPFMQRRGGGRIVAVSSIGGKIAVPHLVPYSASKFALAGLTSGLRAELAQDNIVVTTAYPGLIRTGSPRNALFKGNHRAEYAWFSISDSLPLLTMSSRRAARLIVRASQAGRAEIVLTAAAKIGALANALMPGVTSRVLMIANRLLPQATGIASGSMRGSESTSAWSPSLLTTLTDRAAIANNETLR